MKRWILLTQDLVFNMKKKREKCPNIIIGITSSLWLQGSYGLVPGSGSKMYNHSCHLRNTYQTYDEDMWIRKCPEGVLGCFQAKGSYTIIIKLASPGDLKQNGSAFLCDGTCLLWPWGIYTHASTLNLKLASGII